MGPTSLVRLIWLAKIIFVVTVKESTECHIGLLRTKSNVWLGEYNSGECQVLQCTATFRGYT